MRNGVLYSLGLHLSVAVVLVVGMPDFGDPMIPSDPVPVEIVSEEDLARETAPEPEPQPEPEPEPRQSEPEPAPTPPPAPEPPEVAEAAPPAPTPPEPAPAAEPEPEPVPEPEPEPEPKPEPEPRQTAEADPDPEAKPAPPRPVRKPQVRLADKEEEKPEPRENRLSSILKNVERDLKTQTAETPPEKERPEPKQSKSKVTASKVSQKISASQLEAIRRQIERCWNPPVGARDAEDLVVELRVQLRRDGSVQQARILSTQRMGDPFYRSAAESALRAVRICSPLENLPPEKYDAWRDMRLTFNPREMLGG